MIKPEFNAKWVGRYMRMAQLIASWSKDKRGVGAVIVRPDKTVASLGFNGLPRGVADSEKILKDRDMKLNLILHAEENALISAREHLAGYTIFVWPLSPCSTCAAKIIQSGITTVVAPRTSPEDSWAESTRLGRELLIQAKVSVYWLEPAFFEKLSEA